MLYLRLSTGDELESVETNVMKKAASLAHVDLINLSPSQVKDGEEE